MLPPCDRPLMRPPECDDNATIWANGTNATDAGSGAAWDDPGSGAPGLPLEDEQRWTNSSTDGNATSANATTAGSSYVVSRS